MDGWSCDDFEQYAFCQGGQGMYADLRIGGVQHRRMLVYCASLGALTRHYTRTLRIKPLDQREQVDWLGRLRRRCHEAAYGIGMNEKEAGDQVKIIEAAVARFTEVENPARYGLWLSGREAPIPERFAYSDYINEHPVPFSQFLFEARQRLAAGSKKTIFEKLRA